MSASVDDKDSKKKKKAISAKSLEGDGSSYPDSHDVGIPNKGTASTLPLNSLCTEASEKPPVLSQPPALESPRSPKRPKSPSSAGNRKPMITADPVAAVPVLEITAVIVEGDGAGETKSTSPNRISQRSTARLKPGLEGKNLKLEIPKRTEDAENPAAGSLSARKDSTSPSSSSSTKKSSKAYESDTGLSSKKVKKHSLSSSSSSTKKTKPTFAEEIIDNSNLYEDIPESLTPRDPEDRGPSPEKKTPRKSSSNHKTSASLSLSPSFLPDSSPNSQLPCSASVTSTAPTPAKETNKFKISISSPVQNVNLPSILPGILSPRNFIHLPEKGVRGDSSLSGDRRGDTTARLGLSSSAAFLQKNAEAKLALEMVKEKIAFAQMQISNEKHATNIRFGNWKQMSWQDLVYKHIQLRLRVEKLEQELRVRKKANASSSSSSSSSSSQIESSVLVS